MTFDILLIYSVLFIDLFIFVLVDDRLLRRKFGPKRDEVTGEWKKTTQ